MEDPKQEILRRQRRENATKKIQEIDGKISECTQVRNTLSVYKNQLESELSSWRTVSNKLSGSSKYTKVVTPNVFEGEMAGKLGTYMGKVSSDIKTGISDSESLSDAIQTQISELDSYSSDLWSQRARWVSQLY